jgi:hypothetical protein
MPIFRSFLAEYVITAMPFCRGIFALTQFYVFSSPRNGLWSDHKIKILLIPWGEIWIFKVKNPFFLVKMGFEISMMGWVRNFVFSANLYHFHSRKHMNFFRFFQTLVLVEMGRNRFWCNTFAPLQSDLPSSPSSACHGEQQQPQIKCGNQLTTYPPSFFQKRANRSYSPLTRYPLNHVFPHLDAILLHPSVCWNNVEKNFGFS